MGRYFNRRGEPISLDEWIALIQGDLDYRLVRQTMIEEVQVSTVWLGLDHGWGEGMPVIFETMIFGAGDGEQYRYATEDEAIAHHEQLVAQLRAVQRATT
jgi:hypothetical protein